MLNEKPALVDLLLKRVGIEREIDASIQISPECLDVEGGVRKPFRPYSFFECLGLISTVMSPNDDKFETLPDEIRRVVVEADRVAYALLCNGQMQEVFEQMNRIDEAGMEKMLAESKKKRVQIWISYI